MKDTFLSISETAAQNRHAIFRYVLEHAPVSRTEIWKGNSVSRASVTKIIKKLIDDGLIVEAEKVHTEKGRLPSHLRIREDALYMFIFLWETRTLYLVNLLGRIIDRLVLSFPDDKCAPGVFADIVVNGIAQINSVHHIDKDKTVGLGLLLYGQIDFRKQILLYSVAFGWSNINSRDLFRDKFDGEVYIERYANMIAFGEYTHGCAKSCDHILMVEIEKDGIGAAFVTHGDCQHGSNYMYGELGHTKVNSDIICSCGQKGCLEAVVKDRLQRNNGTVDEIILDYLSTSISSIVVFTDPTIVVLGGKLVESLSQADKVSFINMIQSRIINFASRKQTILFEDNEEEAAVNGMCAFMLNAYIDSLESASSEA